MALVGGMVGRQLPSGTVRTGRRADWQAGIMLVPHAGAHQLPVVLLLAPEPSPTSSPSQAATARCRPQVEWLGLRRLGGRRRTGGRADWQAGAIICRGVALSGRPFCHASASRPSPQPSPKQPARPVVVCRWDDWSASARRRATDTQTGKTGRSGGGACDLPRCCCARLCIFLHFGKTLCFMYHSRYGNTHGRLFCGPTR